MLNHCIHCRREFRLGKWWWEEIETKSRQCVYCGKVTNMETKNLEITVKLNGKEVPLSTISAGTFEMMKILEKPKEIPVARVGHYKDNPSEKRLFLKITKSIINYVSDNNIILAIDPKDGVVAACWSKEKDENRVGCYENVRPL